MRDCTVLKLTTLSCASMLPETMMKSALGAPPIQTGRFASIQGRATS